MFVENGLKAVWMISHWIEGLLLLKSYNIKNQGEVIMLYQKPELKIHCKNEFGRIMTFDTCGRGDGGGITNCTDGTCPS